MIQSLQFREVSFGTPAYEATVKLREEILRKPLNMKFEPGQLAAESRDHHLALWDGTALIACLILSPYPDGWIKMRQVAVRVPSQGKGVGRELVSHSEQFAREQGFQHIFCHARDTAMPFYLKAGYAQAGPVFYEIGIAHYRMEKSLLVSD